MFQNEPGKEKEEGSGGGLAAIEDSVERETSVGSIVSIARYSTKSHQ